MSAPPDLYSEAAVGAANLNARNRRATAKASLSLMLFKILRQFLNKLIGPLSAELSYGQQLCSAGTMRLSRHLHCQ